jgi:hypothetical protein
MRTSGSRLIARPPMAGPRQPEPEYFTAHDLAVALAGALILILALWCMVILGAVTFGPPAS